MEAAQQNISAIIQARMGSTRLPGKVLMAIGEKPMIWHVVERVKQAKKIQEVILAIPNTKDNDVLEQYIQDQKWKYMRGSEEDVLSRYYEAAKKFQCDFIVRITADCPLIDPSLVDSVIACHVHSPFDYTSNWIQRTFPRGMDTEIFSFEILERTFWEAKEPYQREHVTPYIYEHPEKFRLQNVEAQGEFRRPDLRLTVDTIEDLQLVRNIYQYLGRETNIFSLSEILALFQEHPELPSLNRLIQQKPLH